MASTTFLDFDLLPPPPRLHRTTHFRQICAAEGCENETWNTCGHCVECYPEHGHCRVASHWTAVEKDGYHRKVKAHINWRFILRISLLKAKIQAYILRIAERIYAPGGTGCLAAAKEWESYIGSSVAESVHIKSDTGGSDVCICGLDTDGSCIEKSDCVGMEKK